MSIPSEYVLYHMLTDMGFPAPAAGLATDVLLGRHDDDGGLDDEGPGWDDPRWDEERWTITEPETFESSEEDVEFLNIPPDHDWDEYARIAEWQDRLERARRIGDDDVRAAGLPVG